MPYRITDNRAILALHRPEHVDKYGFELCTWFVKEGPLGPKNIPECYLTFPTAEAAETYVMMEKLQGRLK